MNTKQSTDLITSIGSIVGTYVIAKGWIPIGVFNDLLQIVVLAVSAWLGLRSNSTPALITATLAAPEVENIKFKEEAVTPELVKALKKNSNIQVAGPTIWMG